MPGRRHVRLARARRGAGFPCRDRRRHGSRLASVAPPSASAQGVPSFRSVTDAVWVMATVVDREGRLVTDLTKDDFQIVDNGEPRPITVFRNDPLPFALSIMIDISGSMTGNLSVVRRAVREMVNQFRPGDRVSVGTFAGTVSLSQRFTARPDTILSLVNTSVGGVGMPCPLQLSLSRAPGVVTARGRAPPSGTRSTAASTQ